MIRFKTKVTPDIYEGALHFLSLDKDILGRKDTDAWNLEALLSESIRFHNYGIPKVGENVLVDKKDWIPIDQKTIVSAINNLSEFFKNEVVGLSKNLYGQIASQIDLEKKEVKKKVAISAHAGIYAAHLLLSQEYRHKGKAIILKEGSMSKRGGIYFREYEELLEKAKCLPKLLDTIKSDFSIQYKHLLPSDKIDISSLLFQPLIGGNHILHPKTVKYGGGEAIPWDIAKTILKVYEKDNGATEKLFFSIANEQFSKTGQGIRCHWLKLVDNYFNNILRILPDFYSKKLKSLNIWQKWHAHLDETESLFQEAINTHKSAWISWEEKDYISSQKISKYPIGIHCGLPSAFILTGVLRIYIFDLVVRAFMIGFIQAIYIIHKDINGYMGVALWEAVSGKRAVSPTQTACLEEWNNLIGVLSGWTSYPSDNSWGSKSPENTAAVNRFNEILKGLNFEDFGMGLPRHPVITNDFFVAAGSSQSNPTNLLFGATFASQCHIFVALQLVDASRRFLKWNWEQKRYQTPALSNREEIKKKGKGIIKNRTFNYSITAGSYVWGGRKPPHITHRMGVNFDFVLGPEIIPWPESFFKKKIDEYKKKKLKDQTEPNNKAELTGIGNIKKLIGKDKRFEILLGSCLPVVVCATMDIADAQKSLPYAQSIVFVKLVQDELVIASIKEVKKCILTKSNKEPQIFDSVEKKLLGTPHFLSIKESESKVPPEEMTELADWQRAHVGHLCILLSNPKYIKYASPIIHFRAIRAIRLAFSNPLFLFDIKMSVQLFEEINEIPHELLIHFEKSGFPLSAWSTISKTRDENTWEIANESCIYSILQQSENLSIYYKIPDEISSLSNMLVYEPYFDFAPNDHHHHWHVNYHTNKPIDELVKHTKLWIFMGLDLKQYLDYLSQYKFKGSVPPNQEFYQVQEVINNYVSDYDSYFGTKPGATITEVHLQRRSISTHFLQKLFSAFEDKSPLIEPVATKNNYSEEFKQIIKKSSYILYSGLYPLLKKEGMMEDLRAIFWQRWTHQPDSLDSIDDVDDIFLWNGLETIYDDMVEELEEEVWRDIDIGEG